MEVPQAVKRNFVYIGDGIGRVGKTVATTIIRYPAASATTGAGALIEGVVHLFGYVNPSIYKDFYKAYVPGEYIAKLLAAGVLIELGWRGFRRAHRKYKNWKIELNQNSISNIR